MAVPSLRRIAYHTLQQGKTLAGLAHKELSTKLTEVFAPEAANGSFPLDKELIKVFFLMNICIDLILQNACIQFLEYLFFSLLEELNK